MTGNDRTCGNQTRNLCKVLAPKASVKGETRRVFLFETIMVTKTRHRGEVQLMGTQWGAWLFADDTQVFTGNIWSQQSPKATDPWAPNPRGDRWKKLKLRLLFMRRLKIQSSRIRTHGKHFELSTLVAPTQHSVKHANVGSRCHPQHHLMSRDTTWTQRSTVFIWRDPRWFLSSLVRFSVAGPLQRTLATPPPAG